jgi:hypothetical protein
MKKDQKISSAWSAEVDKEIGMLIEHSMWPSMQPCSNELESDKTLITALITVLHLMFIVTVGMNLRSI